MKLELLHTQPSQTKHTPPVLFVHGAWHGAWCWAEHFLGFFAEHGYNAYALSLRGHGTSLGRNKLRITRISKYVEDVALIASQLESQHNTRPIVIGHSMGGLVVQKYLEAYEAPAAVLMASVPPAGVLATTLRIAFRHPILFAKVNVMMSLYPLVATSSLARESFFSANMSDALVNQYWKQLQDESYFGFLDMLAFNLPQPAKVKTPFLVLGAANDTIFYPNEIEATARAYGTNAIIFANMAHDMMLEANWQDVAVCICQWLEQKH
jgi:alpha-beta hydrolase superfamily lysophospholipase